MKLSEIKESVTDMSESGVKGDAFVVIGNWGRGTQTAWPSGEHPGVYTEADAEKLVAYLKKDKEKSGAIPGSAGIAWHCQPIDKALEYVSFGNKAYTAIKKLQAKFKD